MAKVWLAAGWLGSRLLVLALLAGPYSWVGGDVGYYAASLRTLPDHGLVDTLVEYPVPGVALVAVPWAFARLLGRPEWYAVVLAVFGLLTDAGFTALLVRCGRGAILNRAAWFWVLAVPLLGATAFARFDLAPGVLAGTAVVLLGAYPRLAATAASVATGAKLWPALLLPALGARARTRRPVLATAVALGTGLAVASVVLAGWGRLVSPLVWQQDRGLQVESVFATPAMLLWAFGAAGPVAGSGGPYRVGFTSANAYEIAGPVVPVLLLAAAVASVLGAVVLVMTWTRAWRAGTVDSGAVGWMCLAAVSMFLTTSKVLSPQYLLWLLPVAAAALATVGSGRDRRVLTRWAVLLLVATAATQVVFPAHYVAVSHHLPWSGWVVTVLALRNLVLVVLLAWSVREAWRATRATSSTASRPARGPATGAARAEGPTTARRLSTPRSLLPGWLRPAAPRPARRPPAAWHGR